MTRNGTVSILLVDDAPSNLLALEAILSDLGLDLVPAKSGGEAVALAEGQDFAVVLLDVRMPIMDGFQTARKLREGERSRVTPIIFLTAQDDDPAQAAEAYE